MRWEKDTVKYGNNKFANDLLIWVIREMERKLKNWKVEQNTE